MTGQLLTETLHETLSLFEVAGPPLATSEVAERVDVGRRSAYERLERLVEHDRLETKTVGASGRVWWRPATAAPDTTAGLPAGVLDRADVAAVVVDADGSVGWLNDDAERYFGLDRDRVRGVSRQRLVEERLAPAVEESRAFVAEVSGPPDGDDRTEWHVTGAGREERWVERRVEPVETGALAGGHVELYRDITGRTHAERAHERQRRQFDSLVTAVEEYAIFKLDAAGRVQTWNEGAERIKGYDAPDILGEHVATFYTAADREAGVPERNLAAAAERGTIEDEGWRVAADGSRFWANVTITAVYDDDGDLEGYAKITRDMTERREREQALRRERDLTARLFETAPVPLALFDADGSLDRMNSEGRGALGVDEAEIRNFHIDDIEFADADGTALTPADHPVNRVLETGEPVPEQLVQHETPEGERQWFKLSGAPLYGGSGDIERIVVAGEDVTALRRTTDQPERKRDELEAELGEVFARIDDAFFAVDDDGQFVHANEQAETLLDRSVGELLGRDIWEAFPAAVGTTFQRQHERAIETQESVTFEEYYPPLDTWFEVRAYPSESGLSVYFRDVTERHERKRELEQYERAIETIGDGVYVIDENEKFRLVNDAYCELTGYDRETLLDADASLVAPKSALDRGAAERRELLDSGASVATLETELTTADGGTVPVEARLAPLDRGDDGYGSVGVVRDITERRERERELERYETIVETVEDGIYTVDEDGVFTFVNKANKKLLGIPSADLVGHEVELLVEAGIVEPDVTERVGEINERLRAGELESASVEVTLSRPDGTDVETEATLSMLTTHAGRERVGVVRDITDHVERERELERQREQLAALNSLNEVVREVTAAVIDQSTREEIEATVCAYLADSASYLFAWVGEVSARSETVTVRTQAGADGYLEDTTITVDPDDERGGGPTGRAFRTGEIQTVDSDDSYEPWRDRAEQSGVASSAAIPISHEGTMYGTLNVYTARPDGFEGRERTVIAQLGDIVGHAIAAAERKQALLSDEVVELQLVVPDVYASFDWPDGLPGTVRLEHTVPVSDDDFIVYGTVPDDAVDSLRSLTEAIPHWDALTVQEGNGRETGFELRLTDPPMLSAIASVGGTVERAAVEDGDYRMTVHVPTTVDVRTVIDRIEAAYPTVQLRKRQQRTRTNPADRVQAELLADLTDKQRAALETAYHAGFFEWPRTASGEQVASSLSVAATTFHYHMRRAERKVFGTVFGAGGPP